MLEGVDELKCSNHQNNLSLCVYHMFSFFVNSYCQIILKIEAVHSYSDSPPGFWISMSSFWRSFMSVLGLELP
jgi:hypothetical protein